MSLVFVFNKEEDDELGGSLNDGTATQFMSQVGYRFLFQYEDAYFV